MSKLFNLLIFSFLSFAFSLSLNSVHSQLLRSQDSSYLPFTSTHSEEEVYRLRRPFYKNYAEFARWMIAQGSWGVIATSGKDFSEQLGIPSPFANVVSFVDDGTGVPLFYLTELDPTGRDLKLDSHASFVVSEASFPGSCKLVVAEEPTCAKITLTGRITEIAKDERKQEALKMMLSKHPSMRLWPRDHEFKMFEMHISNIFLIDFYGGAPELSVEEYFKVSKPDTAQRLKVSVNFRG